MVIGFVNSNSDIDYGHSIITIFLCKCCCMPSDNENQDILGKLIIDNQDLDLLESMLSAFNIFEATKFIRQETKHSDFIAFLLDPFKNHRINELFLKKLLVCAALKQNSQLSPVDIDIACFDDVRILREWKNIDILIHSPSNRLVCAIENKVDSSEHSNQLVRYRDTICKNFPEYRKILLYLTKEGNLASTEIGRDENLIYCTERWLSISYGEVADTIESIYKKYRSIIGDDVCTLMNHYVSLIRRHIMSESEIAVLCQKIYKQHRQALDLIYDHRPDIQLNISKFLEEIIESTVNLDITKDKCEKRWIRFYPKVWGEIENLKVCNGWTDSKQILLFEFVNEPKYLGLHLVVGFDNIDNTELRKSILQVIADLNINGFRNNIQLHTRNCTHTKSGSQSHL